MKATGKIADLDESGFKDMLAGKCRLVGDAWFPAQGHARERKAYLKTYRARQVRNERRRKRRGERRADETRRILRLTEREWRVLAGSFVSAAVERYSRFIETHHPSDTGILACELPYYLILLDLVQLLDRIVVRVWRTIRKEALGSSDPAVVREARSYSRRFGREVGRRRRSAADAPLDVEHRLACERRKLLCRATVASAPTATDLRVAWRFRNRSQEDRLRLGGLMMDLECFVDNALYGELRGNGARIRGRNPGIRGWLREHCPELLPKYYTLMRYKCLARRARQALEIIDPVPTSALLDENVDAAELLARRLNVQPRGTREPCERFPWENGEPRIDYRGRVFRLNKGYRHLSGWVPSESDFARHLVVAREILREILAASCHPAVSLRHRADAAVHLFREIARRVAAREVWWRGPLREIQHQNNA